MSPLQCRRYHRPFVNGVTTSAPAQTRVAAPKLILCSCYSSLEIVLSNVCVSITMLRDTNRSQRFLAIVLFFPGSTEAAYNPGACDIGKNT